MDNTTQPTKSPKKSFGNKQQQIFAFAGLVLFLTGLVATALLGQFNLITSALCVVGIVVGSVIFLPRLNRNLAVYANMLLYSLFFCGAAIVFFIILQKHPLTFDATRSHNYSLSPVTSNFLKRLDQPIRTTVFVSNKQDRNAASLLLGEYSRYSPQFKYEILDPFREVAATRRFGAQVLPGDVYMERLTTGTENADQITKIEKLKEEQLTNGIVQLLRGRDLVLYFTMGHGEPKLQEDKVAAALSGQGPDLNNLQSLTEQLDRSYIKSVPLDLQQRDGIPSDAGAVVIVKPEIDFSAAETRILRSYIDNGGRVMFLLNADIPQLGDKIRTSLTNVASLVKQYGIDLPPEVVVMPLAKQNNQSIYVTAAIPKKHRITQGATVGEPLVMFEQARPVIASTAPLKTFVETFLVSDDKAWPFPIEVLERALLTQKDPGIVPKEDELKSISLGVAATRVEPAKGESASGKIIVIGNGSFVTSRYLTNEGWMLFMNGVNWITDSGELIAIPSAQIENTPAILSAGQKQFLFILVVIAIPTLIALGGLGYSISRRGANQ